MKTTLIIDDHVFKRLKQLSIQQSTTMSSLVDAALRQYLKTRAKPAPDMPPLPAFDGGRALVDVSNRDMLYQAMEEI
ncbi:MAG: hypothetical protein FJW20_05295 [Acidimicrobiia bacterium]|nr:hypothetical protein [Acidimicrobiia bacterium]